MATLPATVLLVTVIPACHDLSKGHTARCVSNPYDGQKEVGEEYRHVEQRCLGNLPTLILVDLENPLRVRPDRDEHASRTRELFDQRCRHGRRGRTDVYSVEGSVFW